MEFTVKSHRLFGRIATEVTRSTQYKTLTMSNFNFPSRYPSLLGGVLLLAASLTTHAGDIEEANQLFKKAQFGQALDKVNQALAAKPKDAQARFLKGLILTQQNKSTEAVGIFSALTNDYPELPEPYNNLAVLYANQGQYDKARQALEMAIRTHPSYSTAHENLGDIYAKMASQAYDRALKLDHGNTATQTKLAMIQDLIGGEAAIKSISRSSSPDAGVSSAVAAVKQPVLVAVTAKPTENGKSSVAKNDTSQEVIKTLQDWAAAWSSKNTDKYLSHYAADFKVPNGAKRSSWEAEREMRIDKPQSIQVRIASPVVTFGDSEHATVEFRQFYNASHFKTTSTKVIMLKKSAGKWLIQDERVK